MWIDVSIVALVLVFALLGLASGFWGQFLRILAMGSLYFIAPPVARQIRDPLEEYVDVQLSSAAMDGVALIFAALGMYVIMSIVIFILLAVARRGKKSASNKLGGLMLGTTKGVALGYLLLCGFLMVASSDFEEELDHELIDQAQDSLLVELVEEHNFIESMGYEMPTKAEIEALVEEHIVDPAGIALDAIEQPAGDGEEADVASDKTPPIVESPEDPTPPPSPK